MAIRLSHQPQGRLAEGEAVKVWHEQVDPRELIPAEVNAHFMPKGKYELLVKTIRETGVLEQWPFVWKGADGKLHIISGHNRTRAAIDAEVFEVDVTVTDEGLSPDELRSKQLAHNAIFGEDDPTVLRHMYESIEDIELRKATGLDDELLHLFRDVTTAGLSEANLDFMTVVVTFLPDEHARAVAALTDAATMTKADDRWVARLDQFDRFSAAMEDARSSANVRNAAVALALLLDVWDAHREDLSGSYLDGDELRIPDRTLVPTSTLVGLDMHAGDAAATLKALKKVVARGEAPNHAAALRVLADAYLASS